MSGAGNEKSLAAVTTALQRLIEDGLSDPNISVTTLPVDKARETRKDAWVNLFLYHLAPSAAYRNMDLPPLSRASEITTPPLALNLYYLVTVQTDNEQENKSYLLLGQVMSLLHDHPVLSGQEIQNYYPDSDLETQVDQVRITLQPLSLDEEAKIWSAFQTQYRMSAAYQVGVVLIRSRRPARLALPVLKRGKDDRGVYTQAEGIPQLESLSAQWRLRDDSANPPAPAPIWPAAPQIVARLGDTLVLRGQNLGGAGLKVRFTNLRLGLELLRDPLPQRSLTELWVKLDDPALDPQAVANWAPGLYSVSLYRPEGDLPAWASNEIPFGLAPAVTLGTLGILAGKGTLPVSVTPRLRPTQQATLLLGSIRQASAQPFTNPGDPTLPTPLAFEFPVAPEDAGEHLVRVRVDGIESLPYALKDNAMVFDPQQKVVLP